MSATVKIDGQLIGTLTNLSGSPTLKLGSLSRGTHTFTLTDIQGYSIDSTGHAMPLPRVSDLECHGQFNVNAPRIFRLAAVWRENISLNCSFQ